MLNRFIVDQERMKNGLRYAAAELHVCSEQRRAIMTSSTPRFAVVFEPATRGSRTALKTTDDANEATVAFHSALSQLRVQGLSGDVLLHTQDGEPVVLLRQPVMAASR